MLKFTCVVLLAVAATVSCIPIDEPELSKAGLVRPSPINPDVVSEPLPSDAVSTTTQAARESHIQKIPARGTKLSATLDQDKSTSEAPKEKRETATDATTSAKSNFRRDQPSTPSTAHKHAGVSTTTAEPVSLKTPIVHPSGLKVRRSADDTTTSKTPSSSTTRGPLPDNGSSSSSSNNNDDNSGPHFIRPVPVDQILKNLHEVAPQHHQTHHEQDKAVETTTSGAADSEASPGTTVNDHKFHRKNKASTTTTEAPEEGDEQDSKEDSKKTSSEDDSKQ